MKKLLLICLLAFGSFSLKAEEIKLIACENSLEMADWGLEFIKHAEQSIDFAACFFGGSILHEYMCAIEEQIKKHRHLQVYILMSPSFVETKDRVLLNRLEKQYSRQLHITYSITDLKFTLTHVITTDNHMKMLVVDETYFTTGGTNLDDVLCTEGTVPKKKRIKDCMIGGRLASGARDQDVVGKSPELARNMRQTFHQHIALWNDYHKGNRFSSKNPEAFASKSAYKEIDSKRRPVVTRFEESTLPFTLDLSKVQMILGGPYQSSNKITSEYARLISEAKSEIVIANLHFSSVSPIMNQLKAASARGVKMSVVTNGINDCSPSCNEMISWPNRISYLPVLYGCDYRFYEKSKCISATPCNANFYEYHVEDMLYHKKVMIIDRRYFVIGSYNLSLRSDNSDYEMILVIDSKEMAERAIQIINRDLEVSLKISNEQIRDWYFDPSVAYKAMVLKQFNVFM